MIGFQDKTKYISMLLLSLLLLVILTTSSYSDSSSEKTTTLNSNSNSNSNNNTIFLPTNNNRQLQENKFPTGNIVIKSNNRKKRDVYVIYKQVKYSIDGMNVLELLGFNDHDIIQITDEELDAISNGPTLTMDLLKDTKLLDKYSKLSSSNKSNQSIAKSTTKSPRTASTPTKSLSQEFYNVAMSMPVKSDKVFNGHSYQEMYGRFLLPHIHSLHHRQENVKFLVRVLV